MVAVADGALTSVQIGQSTVNATNRAETDNKIQTAGQITLRRRRRGALAAGRNLMTDSRDLSRWAARGPKRGGEQNSKSDQNGLIVETMMIHERS